MVAARNSDNFSYYAQADLSASMNRQTVLPASCPRNLQLSTRALFGLEFKLLTDINNRAQHNSLSFSDY